MTSWDFVNDVSGKCCRVDARVCHCIRRAWDKPLPITLLSFFSAYYHLHSLRHWSTSCVNLLVARNAPDWVIFPHCFLSSFLSMYLFPVGSPPILLWFPILCNYKRFQEYFIPLMVRAWVIIHARMRLWIKISMGSEAVHWVFTPTSECPQ